MTYGAILSGFAVAAPGTFFCNYKGFGAERLVADRGGADAAAMQCCAPTQTGPAGHAAEQSLQRFESGTVRGA